MQEILRAIDSGPKFTAFYKNVEPGIIESCGSVIDSSEKVTGEYVDLA